MSGLSLAAILWFAATAAEADPTDPAPDAGVSGHQDGVITEGADDAMVGGSDDSAVSGDTSRDDAIFGGTESLDSVVFGDGDSPEDLLFDDEERSPEGFEGDDLESRLAADLDEQQNWLDLGGFFYLRLEHNIQDDTAAGESPLANPNLADIYLDGRPNERVRGYLRGRLQFDPTVSDGVVDAFGNEQANTRVLLDQFWLKFDVLRFAYLTVGKQPIRWGSGRFWNPTDFLNQQKVDPLTLFDERNGVGLLKIHIPIESLNWNFYAVANIDEADVPDRIGGALRAEMLFGETEIALTYANRKKNPHQLGIDISSGIWLFDVRAEVAASHGVRTPFFSESYREYLDRLTNALFSELRQQDPDLANVDTDPLTDSRQEEWILQGVGAVELTVRYSDQDTVTFGVEYFFNDAGYDNADSYPLMLLFDQFVPFYAGRHYIGAYAFLPRPGLWNDSSFTWSLLSNLSDESYLARFDFQVRVLTFLDLNLYASYHFGDVGELNYELQQDPAEVPEDLVDDVSQLDPALQLIINEGVDVKQPVLDIGVALRVRF